MQTLRKKTSPLKYKNETSRFLGEGVSFKAKLIGILEVSEARGDRMCQEALSDLKMAIRAAGEHKQRITINIAIDGLRLRDEKTGDSLYHHPVHKISFIAQDMSDSRAFGYIFGSPDTGHRFFGIKTDKAASQVVIAMRDLFQVVFALKKKEVEIAKQHLDKSKYSSSPLFSERNLSLKGTSHDTSKSLDTKGASSSSESRPTPAVADLVDLELELNSLQQGLHQMERITPSDPFGNSDDPFGDSFTSFPRPILPPPPSSGRDRSARVSESSSIFSPKTPHTAASCDSSSAADLLNSSRDTPKDFSFNEFNSSHDEPSSGDWFTPPAGNSLFEDAPSSLPAAAAAAAAVAVPEKSHEQTKQEIMSQFDVFTELDPLGTKNYNPTIGTGKIRPYVDKKHFFQDLKNPPKKVLNDLASENQPTLENATKAQFAANFAEQTAPAADPALIKSSSSIYNNDPFGDDPFDQTDPFADADFTKNDVFESDYNEYKLLNNKLNDLSSENKINNNNELGQVFKTEFTFGASAASGSSRKLFENPSVDLSSEGECAPDPPPRPANTLIKPPPLPPKKQGDLYKPPQEKSCQKEESHYDYIDKYRSGTRSNDNNPPLPAPARKSTTPRYESQFEDDYLEPVGGPLLQPPPKVVRKPKPEPSPPPDSEPDLNLETLDITLSQLTLSGLNELAGKLKIPASQLNNMTLVQLTDYLSNFIKNKRSSSLEKSIEPPVESKEMVNEDKFESDFNFADFNRFNNEMQPPERVSPISSAGFANNVNNVTSNSGYDRYAVFRELIDQEIEKTTDVIPAVEPVEVIEEVVEEVTVAETTVQVSSDQLSMDRYAALREIVECDIRATQDIIEEKDEEIEEEDEEEIEEENQLETIDEAVIEQNNINEDKTSSVENDLNVVQIISNGEEKNNSSYDMKNNEDEVPVDKVPVKEMDSLTISKPNDRTNSRGSLSDVISGSSPEVDNNSVDVNEKTNPAAAESWAIFDQPNLVSEESKDAKAHQSEEGVSPWSSDSKEFGNGSPTTDWRNRRDSESDRWNGVRGRSQEGWWDTSAEPENPYYNRRSTDSYEDECYDCYERPRRRRQGTWNMGGPGGPMTPHGGHSSSSRDVSPWEEEPRRRGDPNRPGTWSSRHTRHSFDRHSSGRDSRRHTDSWDEEDDYEFEEEERFHWADRHRDPDRHPRSEIEEWDERRLYQKRRREIDRDRWCCPDYNLEPEPLSRYNLTRWSNPERRKHDERYYPRESQESPWEDEYSNEVEPHYLSTRRPRIRPSSASEMDRKTGEIKARPGQFHFGGSDGERERRYKPNRRSKSRDSQYAEPSHLRHKPEVGSLRGQTRKPHPSKFEEFDSAKRSQVEAAKDAKAKPNTLGRKKNKESPKSEEANTFPRKSISARTQHQQSLFENDFVSNQPGNGSRFESTDESNKWFSEKRAKPSMRYKQKSLFEDDFSPTEAKSSSNTKVEPSDTIHSIKEEVTDEGGDSLGPTNNFDRRNSKKRLSRISQLEGNLKKSESVNIFARENDPFDDDFFSENANDDNWAQNFDNTK